MFDEIVERHDDIVATIDTLDRTERHGFAHIQARVLLIDGSKLHVSEVWIDDELEKYSYYWLDETDETILGWDNAPHHESVETFPHHKHTEEGVKPSEPMDGMTVLNIIEERLL